MVKDYAETDDTEEILTGLEKVKRWWDAALWVKRIFMTLKILFFGTVGAGMVGQAVNENFLNDAAIEIGLVDPVSTDIVGNDAMYDELSNLIEDVERLEALVAEEHAHAHAHAPHEHDLTHEHQEIDLAHTHPEKQHSHPGAAVSEAAIKDEILKWVPENHMRLH
jgi:hypothetical protein